MKQIAFWTLLAGLLVPLAVATPARAALIGFQPSPQVGTIGSSLDVQLTISGLGNGVAPSLGAFDLDVSFDSSVLALNSVSFGDPILGNQLDLFGFGSINGATSGASLVNLFEISLDLPSDLDLFQADSFTLAVLTFDTLALGTSLLTTSINALGDSLGNALTATAVNGTVQVVAVGEPGTFFVFGVALVALIAVRRRGRPVLRRVEPLSARQPS